MNRLLIASAAALATLAAAVPAVAGLAGNPSFSHKLPVRVPTQAQVVSFDDHGRAVSSSSEDRHSTGRASGSGGPSAMSTATRSAEPGDDRGGPRSGAARTTEPADDSAGLRSDTESAGTASASTSSATAPADDKGSGHGGTDSARDVLERGSGHSTT